MKRDNDYLRELLFKFENSDDYLIFAIPTLGMSPGEQKAYYHIQLLSDARYVVKVRDAENSGHRLTFQGHDFIEAIRDEGIWEKNKKDGCRNRRQCNLGNGKGHCIRPTQEKNYLNMLA